MKSNNRLPDGWNWVRLRDVASINPRRPSLVWREDEPATFVPMVAVDEQLGTIARPEVWPFGTISSGYTYFEEGDVLFAKITPCIQNGKHAVASGLKNAFSRSHAPAWERPLAAPAARGGRGTGRWRRPAGLQRGSVGARYGDFWKRRPHEH